MNVYRWYSFLRGFSNNLGDWCLWCLLLLLDLFHHVHFHETTSVLGNLVLVVGTVKVATLQETKFRVAEFLLEHQVLEV